MTDPIPTVALRNGYEHAEPLVRVTQMSLRNLMQEDAIAFYELVALCRDSTHKLFGNTEETLRNLHLIEGLREGYPATVHDAIREITLAATEGELLNLRMVNPLKEMSE